MEIPIKMDDLGMPIFLEMPEMPTLFPECVAFKTVNTTIVCLV